MFICLSSWISAKHFTASKLSRAADAIIFLISCSSSTISPSESLIKIVSSDCKISAMLFFSAHFSPIYVHWISSCLRCICLRIKVDKFIKRGFTRNLRKITIDIHCQSWQIQMLVKLDKYTDVKVEKCTK